jgi:hypothetical protein
VTLARGPAEVYSPLRMRSRFSGCASVVAVLVALVAVLQLPGPATCPNLSWRWVALELEGFEDDPPEELTEEIAARADAVAPVRPVSPRSPGHAGTVAASAPPHAGPDAVIDSSVTRAPPAA